MSQPMNMQCSIDAKGDIDAQAGEFWVKNPFEMLNGKHNFSAFESNKFFLNQPDRAFADLSYESGADIDSDSRGVIAADFDRDGDIDLLVSSVGGGPIRLFANEIPTKNRRVKIELKPSEGNSHGIGTRVIAHVGDQVIQRDVFPANGFMAQSPPELILGVGTAKEIRRLDVRWPNGHEQTFKNIPSEGTFIVRQSEKTDSRLARLQTEDRLNSGSHDLRNGSLSQSP